MAVNISSRTRRSQWRTKWDVSFIHLNWNSCNHRLKLTVPASSASVLQISCSKSSVNGSQATGKTSSFRNSSLLRETANSTNGQYPSERLTTNLSQLAHFNTSQLNASVLTLLCTSGRLSASCIPCREEGAQRN
jgi:hypothetical protein